MVRLVTFVLLIGLFYLLARSYFLPVRDEGSDPESMEMVQDPNCKIYLLRSDAVERIVSQKNHCFCSVKCADAYEKASKDS